MRRLKVLDMTRQLDLIPRSEMRAEIYRLREELLDIGEVNSALYEGINKALEILKEFSNPEDKPLQDAIRVLRRVRRVKHRRKK
jgi:hypothetical protein